MKLEVGMAVYWYDDEDCLYGTIKDYGHKSSYFVVEDTDGTVWHVDAEDLYLENV